MTTLKKICFAFICLIASLSSSAQNHLENLARVKEEANTIKQLLVFNNDKAQLPIVKLTDLNIVSVDLGFQYTSVFDSIANKFTKVEQLAKLYNSESISSLNLLNDDLKLYNCVILKTSKPLSKGLATLVKELEKTKQVILVLNGTYQKNGFSDFRSPVIISPTNSVISASCLAQFIFGAIVTNGKAIRLKYSVPEEVGINSNDLDSIPLIIKQAINAKGTPGAVVMIVKDGKVIFSNAYGKHTYTGNRAMRIQDIFDMASITKVAATTASTMDLYEKGKIGIDSTIGTYIARTREMSEKKTITVKEVLLHQAGFYPYIKFYEKLKPNDTDTIFSDRYPTQLADKYYLRANYYNEVMWPEMLQDKVLTRGKYVYSDLSMYYMKEMVEKVAEISLNKYADQKYYSPLGMQTAGFLPRTRFKKDQIVPTTENDGWLRNMLVQGFVNDPGAAMLGGVSGHAGFFANANDMAIFCQMLLNKGSYGGTTYLKSSTIDLFTSKQSNVSRRGLGFDRKDPDLSKGYPSTLASDEVFGHTGYTGTAIWIDPKYNMVYVFLSNRVYPDDVNKSLNTLNIRSRIQDVIYRAIKK
jgi:CubicO group peptidase (beta-lactamase class C family)